MKTITMRKSALLVLGVLILGAGIVFSTQDTKEEGGHKVASQQDTRMNPDMMESMAVANDKEFIEGMIPHHQEAIDTAKEVLERGGDITSIKVLARNIITAQEREITLIRNGLVQNIAILERI